MKKYSIFLPLIIIFIFTGCFKTEAPKCSDEQVLSLVKDIYKDYIKETKNNPFLKIFVESFPKEIVKFENIHPTDYQENIKRRSCSADLFFDNNISVKMDYFVQLDEKDDNNFLVEIKKEFLESLIQQAMMQKIINKKGE